MIFANIKSIIIPEGKVKQIKSGSTLIWKKLEEILVEIKNWLSEATDLDRTTIYGGDYNGDGKPDGYKTKTRLSSSSGGTTTADGMCASGLIPAQPGDVIRIKGTTPKYSTASYMMTFKLVNGVNTMVASQSISQQGNPAYWVTNSTSKDWCSYENGILKITLLESKFGSDFDRIRFSAGTIDNSTIVTINQEIIN